METMIEKSKAERSARFKRLLSASLGITLKIAR